MRTQARTYQEPRLSEAERSLAQHCPRGCGGMLAKETQPGANYVQVSVLFCLNASCGWRETTAGEARGRVLRPIERHTGEVIL